MKKTIIDLFESSVAKYGEKTFLLEKTTGEFEPTTYNQTRDAALAIGAGLTASGIERGDRVSIPKGIAHIFDSGSETRDE